MPPLVELELGDIFISYPVAQKQAKQFSIPLFHEFLHLLVHGFTHLCGLDHEKSQLEEQKQQKMEKVLLDKFFNQCV